MDSQAHGDLPIIAQSSVSAFDVSANPVPNESAHIETLCAEALAIKTINLDDLGSRVACSNRPSSQAVAGANNDNNLAHESAQGSNVPDYRPRIEQVELSIAP